jgi:predicted choloylglycine hydrolase
MRHLALEGSYYDMGFEYGKILKRVGFGLPKISRKRLRMGRGCREAVGGFFPEALEEFRGISDASGLDYDRLCAFGLTQFDVNRSCSIFAVTDNDKTLIGRNYDMFYRIKDYCESYYTAPEGGYRSLGQTEAFVGREDGVNEKGLGVAMSGITSYYSPGVAFWIAIRYILDKCVTVQEGVEVLREIPYHTTITFLLADPTGEMAVVEASPMKTAIRKPDGNFIVSTNHFNHPEMKDIYLYEPPDSRIRYKTIVESLRNRRGDLNEKYAMSILSSHKGLVCSHRDDIGLGTLWSTVTHLNTLRVWRAEGHPCTNPYKEDNRLREALGRE